MLTSLGRSVLLASVALFGMAYAVGYADLAIPAVAGCAAVLAAAIFVGRTARLNASLDVTPARVRRREYATVTVRLEDRAKSRSPRFSLFLPHGPEVGEVPGEGSSRRRGPDVRPANPVRNRDSCGSACSPGNGATCSGCAAGSRWSPAGLRSCSPGDPSIACHAVRLVTPRRRKRVAADASCLPDIPHAAGVRTWRRSPVRALAGKREAAASLDNLLVREHVETTSPLTAVLLDTGPVLTPAALLRRSRPRSN